MKVLVTGGSGFLGGAIVDRLLARGDQVRVYVRGNYPDLAARGVEVLRGDLSDAAAVANAVKGTELVFHVGAKAGVWGSAQDYYQSNVVGSQNVLDACRKFGVPRLIYTSSPSVAFGAHGIEGGNESTPYATKFLADYPRTKALAEKLILEANSSSLATLALRPHLIWGPGDPHFLPRILERGKAGKLRRIGNKPILVDSVYIDNAADAHLLASEHLVPNCAVAGKSYFIANDEPLPIWDLVNRFLAAGGVAPIRRSISPGMAYFAGWVCEHIYRTLHLKGEPPMTRFLAHSLSAPHWYDLSGAKRDFGYTPKISVDEGFRRLTAHLKAHPIDSSAAHGPHAGSR